MPHSLHTAIDEMHLHFMPFFVETVQEIESALTRVLHQARDIHVIERLG